MMFPRRALYILCLVGCCLLPANGALRRCLIGEADGVDQWANLCRNRTCITEEHKLAHGNKFVPQEDDGSQGEPERGWIFDNVVGEIEEFICDGKNDAEAIARVQSGIEKSEPVVFRKCAIQMPALKRWRNKKYLRKKALKEFEDLLKPGFAEGHLFPVPGNMVPDLYPKENSGFIDYIKTFAMRIFAWTSKGERRASCHLGTFDNLHTMISEKKDFWIAAPKYAPHSYIDFVEQKCPGRGTGKHGCDSFGCYGFLPFDQENEASLREYPRLKEVETLRTTIHPGDVLLVPAFWLHGVKHYPEEAVGLNIAVAFVHQREDMPDSVFSLDIADFYQKHVDGKVTLAPESCTTDTCPWN
mmetsp:Transcript_9073/g.14481  ORF Transcript_9073/g.14481 Transcript_9073/m.14481 type:complete len:357 (-) Transcript_9073:415-1485(-)|eukprot:jgi/Bigna1/136262/aug1.33_g10970